MKKFSLLPSLLVTLASVLFLYSHMAIFINPGAMIRPLVILWSSLLLLYVPAYWLTRDWDWAGLLLVVLALGLFSNSDFAYTYFITLFAILALLWLIFRFRSKN